MSDRSNALLSGDRCQACEVGGLAGFEGAELRHCDQQGKGGDVGYAGNADQDGEAIGEALVGFDNLGGFDGRDLSCLIAEISLRPCQSGTWRDQLIERPRRAV